MNSKNGLEAVGQGLAERPEIPLPQGMDHAAKTIVSILNEGSSPFGMQVWLDEARRHGIELTPPHVNVSAASCRGDASGPGGSMALQIGLASVKNVNTATLDAIVELRETDGRYDSLADFLGRVKPVRDQARRLIRSGCLDGFSIFSGGVALTRPQLLWAVHHLSGRHFQPKGCLHATFADPPECIHDYARSARLSDELEFLGFIVSCASSSLFRGRAARVAREAGLPEPVAGSRIGECPGDRISVAGTFVEFRCASQAASRTGPYPHEMIMRLEDEASVFDCLLPDSERMADGIRASSGDGSTDSSRACAAFLISGVARSGEATAIAERSKVPCIIAEKVFSLNRKRV